jgi:hypothetical protein
MIALAAISKFTNAITFTLFNIYTNELYPSSVRSLGNGLVNFIGKFGNYYF